MNMGEYFLKNTFFVTTKQNKSKQPINFNPGAGKKAKISESEKMGRKADED